MGVVVTKSILGKKYLVCHICSTCAVNHSPPFTKCAHIHRRDWVRTEDSRCSTAAVHNFCVELLPLEISTTHRLCTFIALKKFPCLCAFSSPAVSGHSPFVGVVAQDFCFFSVGQPTDCVCHLVSNFSASEAHVSELSSSVQSTAQAFSCRVKFRTQFAVLRTIFLRVSTHFSRQGPAVFVPCEVSST